MHIHRPRHLLEPGAIGAIRQGELPPILAAAYDAPALEQDAVTRISDSYSAALRSKKGEPARLMVYSIHEQVPLRS